jgi:hypothetical protein
MLTIPHPYFAHLRRRGRGFQSVRSGIGRQMELLMGAQWFWIVMKVVFWGHGSCWCTLAHIVAKN